MAYHTDIYGLVAAAVAALFSGPALPVRYPGVGGDTPGAGQWVELRYFNNGAINYGLANGGPSVVQGFMRLGICGQPGEGLAPILEVCDVAVNAFSKGYVFDMATNTRVTTPPVLGAVIEEADKVIIPVTIRLQGTYSPP